MGSTAVEGEAREGLTTVSPWSERENDHRGNDGVSVEGTTSEVSVRERERACFGLSTLNFSETSKHTMHLHYLPDSRVSGDRRIFERILEREWKIRVFRDFEREKRWVAE